MFKSASPCSIFQVPQLILLIILFTMIFCGNTCVLIAISMSESGYKTRMNFFIVNLSIAGKPFISFLITMLLKVVPDVFDFGRPCKYLCPNVDSESSIG